MQKTIVRASAALLLMAGLSSAEPLKVRHAQGDLHAFLAIRSDEGKLLGMADVVNVADGKVWRSRLTMHFRDGSVDDETTVYTQSHVFRLVSDHHVQKGPFFPKRSDVTIDMVKGNVTYHDYSDGKDEARTEHMDLPDDLANGMMPVLLQNIPKDANEIKVGFLVTNPKPRLVKFAIHPDGLETYRVAGVTRSAAKYRLHIDIGGLAGVIAPVIGKEPPDFAAWVMTGAPPILLKLYGFLYLGGPMCTLQLASPEW